MRLISTRDSKIRGLLKKPLHIRYRHTVVYGLLKPYRISTYYQNVKSYGSMPMKLFEHWILIQK